MRMREKSVCNVYTFVLVLLCIANILELFVPRMDEGNYFVRMPIQLINGGLLVLMWAWLLISKLHWTPVTKAIGLFIPLLLGYSVHYYLAFMFDVGDYAAYLRFLLWTTSLLFFYEMMLRHGLNKLFMNLYILTFLAGVAKKIFEASLYESETLGAGDTAALPLLFLIPVMMLTFDKGAKLVVLALVAILILISLRRTAIIGLFLCLPFIFKYVKTQLRTLHLVLLGGLVAGLIVYAWGFVGEAVAHRFQDLWIGDRGGAKESFGSGRSHFYKTIWNGWINGDTLSFLFGNGLTSGEKLLMKVDNIKHAHNDFLQIAYTFGLLGIGLWLNFLFRLWRFRRLLSFYRLKEVNLFYICLLSYLIISMASGCVLRITTLPFALSIAVLLFKVQQEKAFLKMQLESEHYALLKPRLTSYQKI